MSNGCGSEKGKWKWIKPPFSIFFKASCNKHDELYSKGGKEIDRKVADVLFLHYMLEDCNRLNFFGNVFYSLWAHIYYYSVRIGGKESFNYK